MDRNIAQEVIRIANENKLQNSWAFSLDQNYTAQNVDLAKKSKIVNEQVKKGRNQNEGDHDSLDDFCFP